MKTIAYFVESQYFGGSEQVLIELIAGLDRQQWRPVIFHRPESGIAPLIERAHQLNVATRAVPWFRDWRTPAQFAEFVRALKREQPAIFHASLHWLTACQAGVLAAACAGVPDIVATVHLLAERAWGQREIWRQRLIATQIDRYIAVSGAIARNLHQVFGIPQQKISVVRNSIQANRFEEAVRPLAFAASSRPIVLTIARLDQQKGHSYLLQAAALVPEALFVFAGDGPERAGLEAQARQLHIADRVIFLGYRQDIPALLASCNVFVLPSLYEGLPISVLETMAAGKPVIATAIEGTNEVVVDRETGLLVPPGQARPLAEAIHELVRNPALAQKLACAGKARAREQFSAEQMVRGVTRIYEELLTSTKGNAP
jgi:glycosyltransferase involved in cell wall biosynthesis